MKGKGILTILSLIAIFFISFFVFGMIYKNANIAVNTEGTKENIKNHKTELTFEDKEYKKLIEEKEISKLHQKEIKEKEAKEKAAIAAAAAAAAETEKINQANLPDGAKIAYLTFDDGPSSTVTPRILDTLKEYNIKATFFVIGNMAENNIWLVKREKAEGHVVANHTYSHDYNYIYANTKNLTEDFDKCEGVLKSIIPNYNSKLVRFPGGSFGSNRETFRQATIDAGYHYVDWNALNNDSDANYIPKGTYCAPVATLLNSIKTTCAGKQHVVILMHDAPAKTTTADSLPQVIQYLKSEGYVFKTLD